MNHCHRNYITTRSVSFGWCFSYAWGPSRVQWDANNSFFRLLYPHMYTPRHLSQSDTFSHIHFPAHSHQLCHSEASLSQVKSRLFKKEKGGDTYSATKQDCVCVCVILKWGTFSTKPLVPGAFVYLCTCWTGQAFTATHTHTVSQEYKVTAKVSHNRRRHIQYIPAQTHSIGSLLVWRDPKINDIDIFSLICLILVLVKYWKSKHVLSHASVRVDFYCLTKTTVFP